MKKRDKTDRKTASMQNRQITGKKRGYGKQKDRYAEQRHTDGNEYYIQGSKKSDIFALWFSIFVLALHLFGTTTKTQLLDNKYKQQERS